MKTRAWITSLALAAAILAPAVGDAAGPTDVAGVPSTQVGSHGPIADFTSGDLELLGHEPIMAPGQFSTDGSMLPIGNNGGVALVDDCAFVGRWHDYSGANPISIIDVADPADPTLVGSVPDSGLRGAVAREIRAIDLPNYELLVVLTFGKYIDQPIVEGGLNALHFYTFTDGDCTKPVRVGTIDSVSFRGHEFYLWVDPVNEVDGRPRTLVYLTTPISGSDLIVVDASDPTAPSLIGVYSAGIPTASATEENLARGVPAGAGKYSHSIALSPDGRTAYVSHWDGGFFSVDTSDFADGLPAPVIKPKGLMSVPYTYGAGHPGNTHSAVRIGSSDEVVVGDEIYVTTDGCPFGWLRTVSIGDEQTPPTQLGEYRLAENDPANCSGKLVKSRNADGLPIDGSFSMHNQTVTGRFALASWYGGGLRVVDVADRANPVEAGAFVPKPVEQIGWRPDTSAPTHGATVSMADDWWVSVWSYPVIRNGVIYITDVRNGLYTLRARPGSALEADLAGISFLEGNSNLGDLL